MRTVSHFVNGSPPWKGPPAGISDIFDPNTGQVQARVALASAGGDSTRRSATRCARSRAGRLVNPQRRARVMFEFKRLVEARMDELAELLSSEHGKVVADSKGDVQRGLEVIEFACGIPHALKGEYTEGAGPGIDVYSMRQPIGVGAGHHAVQLPRHDPDVDVRRGDRRAATPSSSSRQRARPVGPRAAGGAVHGRRAPRLAC